MTEIQREETMKHAMLFLTLLCLCLNAGCAYWPQTLTPEYFSDSFVEVKEDVDDVTGARTL